MKAVIKTKPSPVEVYGSLTVASRHTGLSYQRLARAIRQKGFYEDLDYRIEKVEIKTD